VAILVVDALPILIISNINGRDDDIDKRRAVERGKREKKKESMIEKEEFLSFCVENADRMNTYRQDSTAHFKARKQRSPISPTH
jgi:hypothetical protein